MSEVPAPTCPYCGSFTNLRSSTVVYRADYGDMYICSRYPNCDAYVGVHKGTKIPLGRLANKELRAAKKAAHASFDKLWQVKLKRTGCSKKVARGLAYQWLAREMNISASDCHIGMMDVDACKKVVRVCKPYVGYADSILVPIGFPPGHKHHSHRRG